MEVRGYWIKYKKNFEFNLENNISYDIVDEAI